MHTYFHKNIRYKTGSSTQSDLFPTVIRSGTLLSHIHMQTPLTEHT